MPASGLSLLFLEKKGGGCVRAPVRLSQVRLSSRGIVGRLGLIYLGDKVFSLARRFPPGIDDRRFLRQ